MAFRTMAKWINRIVTTVLFLLLLVMIFLVVVSKASGGTPNIFGYQLKIVLSGSMEPAIQTGSIIAVNPGGDMTRFEKGDVITYKTGDGQLITHRVYKVVGDGSQYVTKGDNNDVPDPNPVLAQNVVAKYTGFTIPYAGYLVNFAKSRQGTALLLILPGVLLIVYSVITIWRALSKLDRDRKSQTAASRDQDNRLSEFVTSYEPEDSGDEKLKINQTST